MLVGGGRAIGRGRLEDLEGGDAGRRDSRIWKPVLGLLKVEGVEEEIRPFCLSLEWRLNRYQQSLYVFFFKDKNTCLPKIKAIHQLFDKRIRVHVHYSKQWYRESNQCKYERHL